MFSWIVDVVLPYTGRALGILAELGGMSMTELLDALSADGTFICVNLFTGTEFEALITPQAIANLIPVLGNVLEVTANAIIAGIQNAINAILGETILNQMPVWVFMLTIGSTGAMIVRIVFHLFF